MIRQSSLPFTSRPLNPAVVPVLEQLKPGQRIRISHILRVGSKSWPVVVEGMYRALNSLATAGTRYFNNLVMNQQAGTHAKPSKSGAWPVKMPAPPTCSS